MIVHNKKEEFYYYFDEHKDEIVNLVVDKREESGLYELCKTFSYIALNAPKIKDEKTLEVAGSFQFSDIETAKMQFLAFVKDNDIKDKNGLLETVHKLHPHAVDDGVNTSGLVRDNKFRFGRYYNFSDLPDDIWEKIEKEIRESISR